MEDWEAGSDTTSEIPNGRGRPFYNPGSESG
jgi:hypothetical protein